MINKACKTVSLSRLCAASLLAFMPIAASQSAAAQDDIKGVYLNIGGAFLDLDFESDSITTPATDVGGGVSIPATTFDIDEISANAFLINGRIGYRINKYFAVEVDGGIGVSGDDASQTLAVPIDTPLGTISQDVNVNVEADVDNYIIGFGRAIWPASEQFDLFARAGYGTASLDASGSATADVPLLGTVATDIPGESFNEDGFVFGGGAEYRFSGKHGLRGDVSFFTGDINALYLAASYSFRF